MRSEKQTYLTTFTPAYAFVVILALLRLTLLCVAENLTTFGLQP